MTEEEKLPSLQKQSNDLINQIIATESKQELDDLTNLFKMNQQKKDLARINRLNGLLEIVDDEVINRVATEPESIENETLLKYMTQTQQQISNIRTTMEQQPLIQINNQKNEIHMDSGLSVESRKKVLEAVQQILNQSQVDGTAEEIEDET